SGVLVVGGVPEGQTRDGRTTSPPQAASLPHSVGSRTTLNPVVFVSNANQDSISVIDAGANKREADIEIRVPGFESLRGVMPIGMAMSGGRLLVAEAGINAIGVIDVASRKVIGHIPAGWFPTAIKVYGDTVYVANAKGHGTGPSFNVGSGPKGE